MIATGIALLLGAMVFGLLISDQMRPAPSLSYTDDEGKQRTILIPPGTRVTKLPGRST